MNVLPTDPIRRLFAKQLADLGCFISSESHPKQADYMATNLLAALEGCADTGDWYQEVVQWCKATMTGGVKPNRSGGRSSPSGKHNGVWLALTEAEGLALMEHLDDHLEEHAEPLLACVVLELYATLGIKLPREDAPDA